MSLIFKKDGIYRKDWVYDEVAEEGKYVETLEKNPFSVWSEAVESIDQEFSLRDLLNYFSQDNHVERLEELTDCNIRSYIKEIDEPAPKSHLEDNDPVNYLEIFCTAEVSQYTPNEPFNFEKYYGIHGVGNREPNYSMSYSHWSTFIDLPIYFEWDCELYSVQLKKTKRLFSGKTKRNYKHKTLMTINMVPDFGELMRDLFVDLCFCGSPQGRDGLVDELNERKEAVDNGTAELVSVDLDKLFDNLLEEKG